MPQKLFPSASVRLRRTVSAKGKRKNTDVPIRPGARNSHAAPASFLSFLFESTFLLLPFGKVYAQLILEALHSPIDVYGAGDEKIHLLCKGIGYGCFSDYGRLYGVYQRLDVGNAAFFCYDVFLPVYAGLHCGLSYGHAVGGIGALLLV